MLKPQKITLAVPFSVFPPHDVRSLRTFHLYRHLAQNYHIEIISLASAGEQPFAGMIAPGVTEKRIPKSFKHQQAEIELVQQLGANVADATVMQLYSWSRKYLQALKKSARDASLIITYQPYLLPAIREVSNKPIWYEAIGVEQELKKQLLPENEVGQEFLERVCQLESQCIETSSLIITSSQSHAQMIRERFLVGESEKVIHIPNGIDTEFVEFTSYEQRLINKEKLGFKDSFLAIFTGTGSPHNADEARSILNMASKLQDINFLLLGDVGAFFDPRLTPPNVGFIASADKKTQSIILSLADVALKPVSQSSESQSVTLEYFCQGVPVISTKLGVKDLDIENNKHCLIGDIWQFPELILSCRRENIVDKKIRLENVRKYVKDNFEWSKVIHKISDKMKFWSLIT